MVPRPGRNPYSGEQLPSHTLIVEAEPPDVLSLSWEIETLVTLLHPAVGIAAQNEVLSQVYAQVLIVYTFFTRASGLLV